MIGKQDLIPALRHGFGSEGRQVASNRAHALLLLPMMNNPIPEEVRRELSGLMELARLLHLLKTTMERGNPYSLEPFEKAVGVVVAQSKPEFCTVKQLRNIFSLPASRCRTPA